MDTSDAGLGKVLPLRAEAGAAEERVLWARFRAAQGAEFVSVWLALQCQAIPGVRAALVLEAGSAGGAFAPSATWPEGLRPGAHLLRAAERVLEKRRALALALEPQGGAEAGPARTVLGQPIESGGELAGAVVLEVEPRAEAELERALRQLGWGSAWLELRARETRGGGGQRLRDLLELAATAVEHERFRAAATAFATELATRLGCERASVGLVSRGQVRLEALSHSARFAKRSNLARAIEAAMEEALDQQRELVWPEPHHAEPRIVRHQAELAREAGAGAICSVPFAHGSQPGGVLTLERSADRPFLPAEVDLLRAVAGLAGPGLVVAKRDDRFVGAKLLDAAREGLENLLGLRHTAAKLAAIVGVALLLFLALAKGDFRVTGDMRLEARELRAAVAPFDGYVAEAPARAGDRVEAGALLAKLDDRELVLERARFASELEQSSKQMRLALSERNAADVAVLSARIDQARAQLELAEDRLARTLLLAPFEGVVVTGDLSQRLGAPVRRGDVLFEVAPLEAYRVVLEADERDVEELAPGQRGTVAFAAFPEESFDFEVEAVTPVSDAKEGSNTFRVEGRLDETPAKLRPGMRGAAKVDAGRRRLLWIWTHDAVDRLRLLVWTWLPEDHSVSEPLFSASWYRVKDLAPRLRPHARVVRHRYRGETWYVLGDPASDRFLRFTPAANQVLALMDGRRSVGEIWKLATERLGDDAPTQDETIRLLGQLHAADVLQCDISPDAAELFDRWQKRERQERKGRWLSPFAIRFHLFDPERFLVRTLPWLRPLLGWAGALLWLAVVVPALFAAATHWGELTENLLDRVFTPTNLVAVWLLFPVLKIFHEFGHGYAAKAFGGEVHDMGVMFLVFTPVPYVDASSSLALPSKGRRALVAAAGMIVEVFLAAIALWVWLAIEPGALRAIAYNALIIGGVTTLLFNANPLLRFDGYYILSDLIEIPNLGSRANRTVAQWIQRRAFGLRELEAEPTAPGEPAWLVGYAIASFVYRIVILVAIVLWIMQQHFLAGVILGAFAAVGWFGIPGWRAAKHLLTGPQLRRVRGRALGIVGGCVALAALLLALAPVPLRTRAEGVVWLPEEAHVRAGADGFIGRVVALSGAWVRPGDLLLELRDPELEAALEGLEARVRELEARRDAERMRSRVAEQLTLEELHYASRQLGRARERAAELSLRSAAAGQLVIPRSDDLVGRFVAQGELLAWVVNFDDVRVRAVVPQDDLDLVRQRTRAVELRLAQRLDSPMPSELLRVVPAASAQLPSVALGVGGGGEVPVDPTAPQGDRAALSLFEVELSVPADAAVRHYGGRVYVRFDHGSEPLAVQWGRRLRQLFLARFHV